MRNAPEAADQAEYRAGSGEVMHASGYCLQFTRENYPMGSYYFSAIDAWNAAEHPHPGGSPDAAPPGYPGYWYSSSVYRHVAVCLGGGRHASVFNEQIKVMTTAEMHTYFGSWIGWAEDLNTIYIPSGTTPANEGDDDMRMIQKNKSTGSVALIGDGWYLSLGTSSVTAFQAAGYAPPKVIPAADFDTIIACLVQGKTAAAAEVRADGSP
jgi:hypothetical protein